MTLRTTTTVSEMRMKAMTTRAQTRKDQENYMAFGTPGSAEASYHDDLEE